MKLRNGDAFGPADRGSGTGLTGWRRSRWNSLGPGIRDARLRPIAVAGVVRPRAWSANSQRISGRVSGGGGALRPELSGVTDGGEVCRPFRLVRVLLSEAQASRRGSSRARNFQRASIQADVAAHIVTSRTVPAIVARQSGMGARGSEKTLLARQARGLASFP